MHESALARQILEQVLARAEAEGASRVVRVRGRIAESEALEPSALELHFQAHARGTLAEGGRLALDLIQVRARCHACGTEYLPDHHLVLCPECGSPEGALLGRPGVWIETIEMETDAARPEAVPSGKSSDG